MNRGLTQVLATNPPANLPKIDLVEQTPEDMPHGWFGVIRISRDSGS